MMLLALALQAATAEVGPAKLAVTGGTAEFKRVRGTPMTEVVPKDGAKTLRIDIPSRFVVLPDFFSDDLVFDPTKLPGSFVELPSENFLLHLAGDGDSLLMVVFENRDQDVKCRMSKGKFAGSEVEFGGKKIWVAHLQAPGIWHAAEEVKPAVAQKLAWTMPWPAQWRTDFTRPDGLTDSWDLLLQKQEGGAYTKPSWMGQGAETIGVARKRWTTVLGSFLYPCWSDANRAAYLQPLQHEQLKLGGPVVIYPANRVPETPPDAFTVLDVARAALGAGPCEYILDLDNQKSSNKGHATCWTRDWLTPVYAKGEQKAKKKEIEQNLDQVLVFVKYIRERITRYSAFLAEMRTYLAAQAKAHPELKASIDALDAIAQAADRRYQARAEKMRTPDVVAKMNDDFRKSLLEYEGPDAAAKLKAYTDVLVEIGDNQDQLAGELRWEVRALRQRAGLLLAAEPKMAGIAAEIRKRTQEILRSPAGHEGARH